MKIIQNAFFAATPKSLQVDYARMFRFSSNSCIDSSSNATPVSNQESV